ncbi:T9SS type B sorting domain-containing protein [Maribacter sp. 2308TA10-17]|uniref:T9SS type B sorting domain-containing protein n=1 Tax=Maribacter sp. 2308TA10-17 TaxID=3386276 RepID=UPI0039BD06CD
MMPNFTKKLLLLSALLLGFVGFSQEVIPFTPRLDDQGNSYISIKGDYTLISNTVMNRRTGRRRGPNNVNVPHNGTDANNNNHIEYVDIDNDTSTFSSSSSTLSLPDCSRIYYAGLYWAGNYDRDVVDSNYDTNNSTDRLRDDNRRYDYTSIKFMVPGGTYVDLQADNAADPVGEEDEIIIDGFTRSPQVRNRPYVCYKNVTNQLQALADPTGEYTVANVRGTRGQTNYGAAGWTLVIIYENPTMPGRYIATFDGYAGVANRTGERDVTFPVSGFNTIPTGPVRAKLGAVALEGETSISGDSFQILSFQNEANGGTFSNLFTAVNDVDNFFNANITEGDNVVLSRNINGTNSMGYDSDVFPITNGGNSVIGNGETGATLRMTTTGDAFGSFLATFGVDIIEPDIVLEKTVETPLGAPITGLGVNLGDRIDYVLKFQNIGNDDATGYTIRDVLPINVFPPNGTATSPFEPGDIEVPTGSGITYTYDIPTRTLLFTVPDNLVIENSIETEIRLKVRIAEDCFDFVNACSNQITNRAYSTYRGVNNPTYDITDDPSVSEFNSCGFVTPTATNFLLDDLENCNFTRTVQLCSEEVLLDAGDGFDSYVWVTDDNNNGLFDATDTIITDGDPDNDPSTILVTQEGTYIVDKIVRDPCKGFKEILIVERFGTNSTNPIVDYFNTSNTDTDVTNDIEGEITTCTIDGDSLVKLFLCGAGDSQLLQTGITDAQSIVWEQLDEGSCAAAPDDCANKNGSCNWNQIWTGGSYNVTNEGKYRLVITYQDGCLNRFYFDAFQNNIDVQTTSRDIVCSTPGRINVTNPQSGYAYQLVDLTNNVIVYDYSDNNGPDFTITTVAEYRVDAVQLDNNGDPVLGGCVFSTNPIAIVDRDFRVEIETTPQNCNDDGTVQIDILNVEPNYTYTLTRRSDGAIVGQTTETFNRHTFNAIEGEYTVEVTTPDGCSFTEDVDVTRTLDPRLTAEVTSHIGCSDGTIVLTATNGLPGYAYAIWSKDGPSSYTTINDIPGSEYQGNTFTFSSGENGVYEFVVVDANNCSFVSAPITINDNGPMTLDPTITPIVCSGSSTASLTIGTIGGVAPFMYSIDDGVTYQTTDTFINLPAGNYNLRVTDASGCEQQEPYIITEPFTLSASAGVTQVVECNPTTGAEVRITNAQGGTAPYEYSFNGGTTFVSSNIDFLLPGSHNLVIRDAVDCRFPMTVVVPDPVIPPTFTHAIDYECDGEGTITINSSNTTDFDYTYELNTVLNTPADSNVFTDVPSGAQTVTVNYVANTPPVASVLFLEDFGVGPTTSIVGISEIDPVYCYEQQSSATCDANDDVNDLQYSVTNSLISASLFGGVWLSPNDQDDPGNGRYYVLNVGDPNVSGPDNNTIVYAKRDIEIIPNREISVSLDVINLVRQGNNLIRPNILIELVDSSGVVIASETTGLIPENTGPDNWIPFNIPPLDPGANSTIDIVIRTIATGVIGNDVAIDNIEASQMPEICASSVDIPVVIEAGRAFEANIINTTNVSCNGLSDGTITFEVENFDATDGFNYSIDGATPINSTNSPETTLPILDAGSHTITIHKADDPSCTTSVTIDITEPDPLVVSANIDVALTCNNGATISASTIGGTPNYIYQLEDDATGNPVGSYDFASNGNNTVFTNLPSGDYIVRVRDKDAGANYCEDVIDAALTVAPLNPIVFDAIPSTCYSGAGDASIVVNVTSGNGGYQFRRDGGPWITPTPANATTYTFENLTNGTYDIEVRDALGCPLTLPAPETVVIDAPIIVSATAPNITACATSTFITISTTGGDGSFQFAVMNDGDTPNMPDFDASTVREVFAAGDYDIYLRDPSGGPSRCSAFTEITIVQDAPLSVSPAASPVTCFGGNDGSIAIGTLTGGQGPFRYSIDNGVTYQLTPDFPNLTAGSYTVQVMDSNNCPLPTSIPITVAQPDAIVAEALQTADYTCLPGGLAEITVGSITPTTGGIGSGSYQYRINNGPWTAATSGGTVFTNLTDGTYSIQVRDATAILCVTTLADVIVPPLPTEPTLAEAVTYNCDGTGNITITPFDTNYTYILDGVLPGQTGAASNIFNNVAVGTHTVTVDYGNSCTVDIPITVADGNAFDALITTFENLDCNGDNSGTITITATNFSTGFQYSLNGGSFSATFTTPQTIPGLNAQIHNIVVRDANLTIASGCPITLTQELTEPDPLVASASITSPITCDTGATITASAIGGTPNYQYRLETTGGLPVRPYQTTTTFTDVPAGDYIVRVQDKTGGVDFCEDIIDTPINIVDPISPSFTARQTACYSGANDGEILVEIDAGSLPGNGGFQFSITGSNGPWITPTPATATSHIFTGLTNGAYTIDVRDAFGCAAAQQTVTINQQITANAVLDQDLTCMLDASVTVNSSGGSNSFTYEWATSVTGPWNTTGFTSNIFTTNAAGTYFFRVTDTTVPTACEVVTNSVVVTPAVLPSITSVTPTNLNCNADNSGALDIVFDTNLGLAPYVINVQNTSTSTDYGAQTSGLPAGNYTVTLTDAKGCVDTETTVITEPSLITYTPSNTAIQCDALGGSTTDNTSPGSISISGITGGTPEYTYYLTANNGIPPQTHTTTPTTRDHTFTILSFGIYQIDVVDANGCSSFSTEIIASPPTDLGIDISTSTANCADGGTAIVTVDSAFGSGDYQFAILETFTAPYSTNYVGPDVVGGDTATFSSTANGIYLQPGLEYTFVVFDNVTKCYYFEEASAPIDTPSNMTSTLGVVANVTCTGAADGNISFTFDNYDVGATSVDYQIFNAQSNVFTGVGGSINPLPSIGTGVPVDNVGPLPPGEYYLLLSEVGGAFPGCSVFGGDFMIRESVNLLDISLDITKNDNCNLNAGVITATGTFGTAPYEYQFLPTGSTAPTIATWAGSSNNVFNGEGGTYDAYIKDANGCIQAQTILLPTDPSPEISVAVVDECLPEGTYEVIVTLDAAGLTPYSLSVNNSAFQNITFNGSNQYTVSNLSSGLAQTVAIQDLNGCGETETFDIQPPLQFTALPTKVLACPGSASPNAEITIEVTEGSGNYQYEISGPVNAGPLPLPSNPFIWNLASLPGTYTVTISDLSTTLPYCEISSNVVILPPVEPNIFVDSSTDITCFGANDGTISVSTTDNGIGPYNFEITSFDGAVVSINPTSSTDTTAEFTGLAPTTTATGYIVTVRGNSTTNNCPTPSVSIPISEPAIVDVPLTAITIVPFACTAGNNGNFATISVNTSGPGSVTGGSGNYTRYAFIDAATSTVLQEGPNNTYTETIFSSTDRDYDIIVYDDRNCSNALAPTRVTVPGYDQLLPPTITVDTAIRCDNSGADITINAFGSLTDSSTPAGLANYEFRQLPSGVFDPLNEFTNLPPDNYVFEVRNVNTGCVISVPFTVEDPNTFVIDNVTSTNVTCQGDSNGSVTFDVTDLIGGYSGTYSWDIFNTQGTPNIPGDDGLAVDSGTSASFSSNILPEGEYRISVTQDSAPTCANEIFFAIAEPTDPLSMGTPIVTDITCVPSDNGVIEIFNAQGGWGDYRYLVFDTTTSPAPDTNDRSIYSANPRFEALSAGTYEVWLIDANGCTVQHLPNIVLANPSTITGELDLITQNCTSFEGVLQVINQSGGQDILANYSYQLQLFNTTTSLFEDFRPIQSSDIFSGLGAGQYQVIISDQWGCAGPTINTIDILEPIVVSRDIVKAIDCVAGNIGGAITITQTGGSGSFDYSVTYPDGTIVNQATGIFTNLTDPGAYVFTVTDQATGNCSATITETLEPAVHPMIGIDASTDDTCNDATSNGTISVSVPDNGIGPYTFRIIDGNGSSPGSPILPTSQTSTTATFTGLTGATGAGITYTIEVEGNNECIDTITRAIIQPDPIVGFGVTVTPFECTSGNNPNYATLTVDAGLMGGSGNFTNYRFVHDATGTIVQEGVNTSYTETNSLDGNYTITVFDDKGCSATTTATIIPFVGISDPVITMNPNVTCNPGDDAEIQVSVTMTPAVPATVPTLEYTVTGTNNVYNNTNNTGAFTGLGVGNYIVTITNMTTGCIIETTHTIADPDVIEVIIDKVSDNPCLDDAGGFDVTTINNYSGGFSYQVFDSNNVAVPGAAYTGNGNTTALPLQIRGLSGGGYYITITETDLGSPMCSDNSNVITIIEPTAPITFTPTEEASVSCSNDQGVILIDPSGGNGLYNIVLTNTTTGQPPYIANGVSAAQFTGLSTGDLTGLSAGDYTVTVTDESGCFETRTITLVRPTNFLPTIDTTPLTCFNGNNGEVFTQVPSRSNPSLTFTYEYALNTYDDLVGTNLVTTSAFQSSLMFENRSAGFYSITVRDNFGCSFTSPIAEIVNPDEVNAQLASTSAVTCATGMELTLFASGGLPGASYEYRRVGDPTWIPMGLGIDTVTIPTTGDLPAGTYRYEVRDADNGCTPVQSNEIHEDPIVPLDWVSLIDTDISCNGFDTGRIAAVAQFGMGNYEYELYYNPIGGQAFSSASILVNRQTSGEFSGLDAGYYFVRAISGIDCFLESTEIEISEPLPLQFELDVMHVRCYGEESGSITVNVIPGSEGAGVYQYAISPNLNQFVSTNVFENLAPGPYTIVAQDQNGCPQILETIIEPADQIVPTVASVTPYVCLNEQNGSISLNVVGGTGVYSTRLSTESSFIEGRLDFNGLSAGVHIIFVKDSNDCPPVLVDVTIAPGPNLDADVVPVYECTGDTPDNYVNITLKDPSVYNDILLYALDSTDPNDMIDNPDFRNIPPGDHSITIAHEASGCFIELPFTIGDFEPLTLSLEQSGINTITATADGGLEDYTFYFDGINNGSDNTYIINRTDTYVVRVVDENGCEVTASIPMEFIDIEIPNFFTPDGDGQNDVWMPLNQEGFPEILTIIFDRYGREVYRMTLNSPGWDGLYNQSELPTGDYWYVIKLRGANDDREFVGHFTLYR